MIISSKDLSLFPWQSISLIFLGGVTAILLIGLILTMLFRPSKNKSEEKWYLIFRWIALAFVLSAVLTSVLAISFLVDVKLGWKLSLLAGISMALGIVSIIAMFIGAFTKMSLKVFLIWMFLCFPSFAITLNLALMASGCF